MAGRLLHLGHKECKEVGHVSPRKSPELRHCGPLHPSIKLSLDALRSSALSHGHAALEVVGVQQEFRLLSQASAPSEGPHQGPLSLGSGEHFVHRGKNNKQHKLEITKIIQPVEMGKRRVYK